MSSQSQIAIAADIGGTNIRIAAVTESGQLLDEYRFEAALSQYQALSSTDAARQVTDVLQHAISAMLTRMHTSHKVVGIGIGFPGFFNTDGSVLLASPNIPQLKDVALASMLSDCLQCSVYMQNDALCAAIGEHVFGTGKELSHVLHITLGTGVGAGVILNYLPYVGETGMAMEFGHIRTVYDDTARQCGCGAAGCLESYASASGVLQSYQQFSGQQCKDTATVYHAACQGDEHAIAAFALAGKHLGQGLAHAVTLFDIRHISISGGLLGAWEFWQPALLDSLNTAVIPLLRDNICVVRSSLADDAGVLGAAALVLKN